MMVTTTPFREGSRTYISDPWPITPPWRPHPTYPDPIPYIPPYPYPATIGVKTTTTTGGDILGIKKLGQRIKELEALLAIARDELMLGDEDALAVCELIEECLE